MLMFSVLIPVYNHRRFLVETVVSALRSPLVGEVLVIDDGSTDGSAELLPVVRRLSPKVAILSDPPGNRGAHARLNQLAAVARHRWLAVLNSDDQFAAGRMEAVARSAADGKADLIFGSLVLIDETGARIGLRHALRHNEVPWPEEWDLPGMVARGEWLRLLALQNLIATTSNMVFTKELHERLGGFREYRYCHDWDFALRAALHGRLCYVPTMFTLYRLHGSNTIREGSEEVISEPRRMLARIIADHPSLRSDDQFMGILARNHYLAPRGEPALAVVLPQGPERRRLQQEIDLAGLPVAVADTAENAPPAAYLYEPDGRAPLRVNDLRAVLLAIATRSYDALLLSRAAEPPPQIGARDLSEALVVRRDKAATWRGGAIRVMRLYPPETVPRALSALLDPGGTFEHVGATAAGADRIPGLRVPVRATVLAGDRRPVVIVLPVFLAVGGVERVLVATMRRLGDRWRFVVVTTEPLRPEQGSMHAEAQPLAAIYDLVELVRDDDRLRALELVKDWHGPDLVWVCNGAPWQIAHAPEIRRLFADIPIVDQQAYDHEVGWITRLGDPGVADSDRFVATNRKIRDVMRERYAIPEDRIDLILPGFDLDRIERRDPGAEAVAAQRRHFGFDPHRPLFGMLGRLTRQKRPLDLVELAGRIGPGAQFCWVGSGELEEAFRAAAADLPNVRPIPAQSEVQPIYEMLDGLVITSEFEGLPVVLLEALALGVPAVSTDVGEIGAVLQRYGAGFTFAPPGDLDALERAFRAFWEKLPEYRAAARREAGRAAEDFSSARMAREYDACFRRAIRQFRSDHG